MRTARTDLEDTTLPDRGKEIKYEHTGNSMETKNEDKGRGNNNADIEFPGNIMEIKNENVKVEPIIPPAQEPGAEAIPGQAERMSDTDAALNDNLEDGTAGRLGTESACNDSGPGTAQLTIAAKKEEPIRCDECGRQAERIKFKGYNMMPCTTCDELAPEGILCSEECRSFFSAPSA